jgi:phosphoserine phosphatase RsbU/P
MQSDVDEERPRKTEVRTIPLPDSMRAEDVDLRSLISHNVAVQIADPTESVFTRFAKSQTEFMAVLDGERLVGICSRHRLSELLGGRYGFALWARKPIGMHLSPHETRVSVTTPIDNVLRKVFARTDDAFYDDVLLVDERESFLGLITTQTLFKVQNALLRTNISDLVDKEHEIRSKNEQMETDLRMAMELQQALMSFNYPRFCGDEGELKFSHRYRPASIVGGDFFFIGRISDSCAGIFICDVMGHGVRSALITSMLRALIEALGPRAAEPDFLLTELNRELASILRQTDTTLFVTAVYCTIDAATGQVRTANAGHPGPLHLVSKSGEVRPLFRSNKESDPVLGLLPDARYHTSAVELEPNDCVLLFTDGLIEAERDDGQLFGVDRLIESLRRNSTSPENLLENMENDACFFAGKSTFDDDICLLAVQWMTR